MHDTTTYRFLKIAPSSERYRKWPGAQWPLQVAEHGHFSLLGGSLQFGVDYEVERLVQSERNPISILVFGFDLLSRKLLKGPLFHIAWCNLTVFHKVITVAVLVQTQ